MATEYTFLIGDTDAQQVSDALNHAAKSAGLVGQEWQDLRSDGHGARLTSGLLVAVSTPSPLPFPDPVEEELGFAPTADVLFRYYTHADGPRQRNDMIRLVSAVLNDTVGDAMLAFAGEVLHLLRKDDKLKISDRDDFWTPEIIALLPQPYERAHFPVL